MNHNSPNKLFAKNWLTDILFFFYPLNFLNQLVPQKVQNYLEKNIEKILISLKIFSLKSNFDLSKIPHRTATFIEEAKKYGLKFQVLSSPFGYTNFFHLKVNEKIFSFEGLPRAEFLNTRSSEIIDDKALVKKMLQKHNLPVAKGRAFCFFEKHKAIKWAIKELGFPLVVKPRSGSLSQSVFTDLQDLAALKNAVKKVCLYSPFFIIEEYLSGLDVFRATVVDFDHVFCAKREAANVIGDGISTIYDLINKKNKDLKRGDGKTTPLFKIIINQTTKSILEKRGYTLNSVPKKGEKVFLQKDPFLYLGGDVIEVTEITHPDNLELFQKIAKIFNVRLVAIDFMTSDISKSWQNQKSAILELNSLPSIEIHHFPSSGKPKNVAQEIVKMVFKYYK
jgi:D-alanine-D-alanine ligase-like ATP-grasp enzyme